MITLCAYLHTRTTDPARTRACTGLGSTMMAASTWKMHAVRAEYAAHFLHTDHRPLCNAHRIMDPLCCMKLCTSVAILVSCL